MLHANVHRTMLTKYLPYVQVEKILNECAEQRNEKMHKKLSKCRDQWLRVTVPENCRQEK